MSDGLYVDSSALVKLIVEEAESSALREALVSNPVIVSSQLAQVEVHRAARLTGSNLSVRAQELLTTCRLLDVSADVIARARDLVSSRLRTLDAIHLASALRVDARHFITYDRRLIEPASDAGLCVLHPGLST